MTYRCKWLWLISSSSSEFQANFYRYAHREEFPFSDIESLLYDVVSEIIKADSVCRGAWHNDPELQVIGKHFLIAILNGMEPISLRLLTEHMGWSIEELHETVEDIGELTMKIAGDHMKAQGLRMELRVLIGRKPFDGEIVDESPGSGTRTPTNEHVA